jgi:hypothetical protein
MTLQPSSFPDKLFPQDSLQLYPCTYVFQVLASCVAHSIVIQAGVGMAYSAVLLPQLAEPESIPTVTKVQSSWIGM